MMETERPWQSRTQWVNFISAVAAIILMFGFELGPEQQAAIVTVILLVVNAANMYLRTDSTKVVTWKAPQDPVETDPPTGV